VVVSPCWHNIPCVMIRRFVLALLALAVLLPGCANETDVTVRNMKLPQGLDEDPEDRCGPLEKDGKYNEDGQKSEKNPKDAKASSKTDECEQQGKLEPHVGRLIEPNQKALLSTRRDVHATDCLPSPCRSGSVDMGTSTRPDVIVVAFGDSFASGEGAPFIERPRDDYWQDDTIELNSPQWPASRDSRDTLWGPVRCHRSPHSTFARSMADLARTLEGVRLAWRSFACSGAETAHLISEGQQRGSFEGLSDGPPQDPSYGPQFDVAEQWIRSTWGLDVDSTVAYINIGGNDAGFSSALSLCVSELDCHEHPDMRMYEGWAGSNLATGLSNVNQALANASWFGGRFRGQEWTGASVVSSVVPNPAYDGNVPCGEGHPGGRMDSVPESRFSQSEVRAVLAGLVDTLQTTMRRQGRANGWSVVEAPDFQDHGICSQDSWINTNEDAINRQGADFSHGLEWVFDASMGQWHPNAEGYAGWTRTVRPALAQAITQQLPSAVSILNLELNGPNVVFRYRLEPQGGVGVDSYRGRSINHLDVVADCLAGYGRAFRSSFVFEPEEIAADGEFVTVRPCDGDGLVSGVRIVLHNCFLDRYCGTSDERRAIQRFVRGDEGRINDINVDALND
jgi:hypothetical protein